MTETTTTVALVDDDADLRKATGQLLSLSGYAVREYADGAGALAAIDRDFAGVVVTDLRMPGMSGIELFRALHERDAELPVVLVTGHGDIDTAVTMLKAGAWDFLTKPFAPDDLLAAIARGATARNLTIENRRLRAQAETFGGDELVGRSDAIRSLRATIAVLATTDLDVVIEGATGTGKQLLARLLHRTGRRGRHRFVTLDCATLPTAARDDLFGPHGAIARAHRGTLFLRNLDRAGEAFQHRIAEFVERRGVALDTRAPQPVDVRVVAAMAEDGRTNVLPALFHRLAGVTLRMPPLAERAEDVPLLVAHFLATLAEQHGRPAPPTASAGPLLSRRDWSGNVRELEMAVERVVLGIGAAPITQDTRLSLPERVRAFERDAIVDAVRTAEGDVQLALSTLSIPRETFYYRVKRLGIDLKQLRSGAL